MVLFHYSSISGSVIAAFIKKLTGYKFRKNFVESKQGENLLYEYSWELKILYVLIQ